MALIRDGYDLMSNDHSVVSNTFLMTSFLMTLCIIVFVHRCKFSVHCRYICFSLNVDVLVGLLL